MSKSKKRCFLCGKYFNQNIVLQITGSELIKKYSDGKGGVDRCLSCMCPDREKECQDLKAGDGLRDFYD